jgi:CPA1 family monovalent cation:H+ antiporter
VVREQFPAAPPTGKIDRKSADVSLSAAERLGRRAGLELGWSGMRGAITVAAAQSRPVGFPLRP